VLAAARASGFQRWGYGGWKEGGWEVVGSGWDGVGRGVGTGVGNTARGLVGGWKLRRPPGDEGSRRVRKPVKNRL
jgi:hypothetical protein